MSPIAVNLVPVADHSVLVVFGGRSAEVVDDEVLGRVHALDAALGNAAPAGLVEIVPALTTLLVEFDPLVTDHDQIGAAISEALVTIAAASPETRVEPSTREHVVDVCFDAPHAPDLVALAARLDVDPEVVIQAQLSTEFRVGMYGFAPGYAYLYGTPAAIQVPRRPAPGAPVPAGSVIIAGQQCLVIPVAMSTGWYAIGRTATQPMTRNEAAPFLFDVGDSVRFRRITATEFERQQLAAEILG